MITKEMLKKAISDMSDFNVYAGVIRSDMFFIFSSSKSETFGLAPNAWFDPKLDDEYPIEDLAEDSHESWQKCYVNGSSAFVLIRPESITFMRVPADKSDICWINR